MPPQDSYASRSLVADLVSLRPRHVTVMAPAARAALPPPAPEAIHASTPHSAEAAAPPIHIAKPDISAVPESVNSSDRTEMHASNPINVIQITVRTATAALDQPDCAATRDSTVTTATRVPMIHVHPTTSAAISTTEMRVIHRHAMA